MIGNLFTAIMLTTGFVGACMLLAVGIHYLAVFHDWLKIREYRRLIKIKKILDKRFQTSYIDNMFNNNGENNG